MNITNLGALTDNSLLAPGAQTATATSAAGLDLQQYEGVLLITQEVGVVSGTTPTWAGKIQDSADNSSFADVTGYTFTFTQVTATGNKQSIQVDTRSLRRYIQYVGTIGGSSTPTFNVSVRAIGAKKQLS